MLSALVSAAAAGATDPSTHLASLPSTASAQLSLPVSPTQIVLFVTLVCALAYVWYVSGRGTWHATASERLLYGVPWGTAVTVSIVLAFYLLVQRGLWQWSDPLFLPFISWSYFYPTGLLTAGIAHASPAHLLSNVAATLVLAPIAEYAWSHYPPRGEGERSSGASTGGPNAVTIGIDVLDRPWVRAVVVFPTVILVVSYVTSMLSWGPSLGFSGAVFAIAGFAIVTYPLASIVGILATGALRTLLVTFNEPVLRATVEQGPPMPPSWAGIAFQAHFLGFLIGVLAGLVLLYRTERRPLPGRVFLATLLFGMFQGLWLVVGEPAADVYVLYRGVGVVIVFLVTVLITAAVAGTDTNGRPILELPSSKVVRMGAAVLILVLTMLVVLPSPFAGLSVVDGFDAPATDHPESGATVGNVTVQDYTVTYVENASSGYRFPYDTVDAELAGTISGVVVVSPDRDIWTVATRARLLEHYGDSSVAVGGVGWRSDVAVERIGWDVTGGDTAYAVDLSVGEQEERAYRSAAVRSDASIDGYDVEVVPTTDDFELAVARDGESIDRASLPETNQTERIGPLTVTVRDVDDATTLVATHEKTRVPIATREQPPA